MQPWKHGQPSRRLPTSKEQPQTISRPYYKVHNQSMLIMVVDDEEFHSILAWAPLSSLGSSGSRAVALYFQSGNTCRVETGTAGPILGWYIHSLAMSCHQMPSVIQSYCHEKSWVTMTTSETSISAWSKRQVSMFIGYDHCLELGRPNMAQHSPNNQPRLLDLVAYIICCSCWLSSSSQLHGLLETRFFSSIHRIG